MIVLIANSASLTVALNVHIYIIKFEEREAFLSSAYGSALLVRNLKRSAIYELLQLDDSID